MKGSYKKGYFINYVLIYKVHQNLHNFTHSIAQQATTSLTTSDSVIRSCSDLTKHHNLKIDTYLSRPSESKGDDKKLKNISQELYKKLISELKKYQQLKVKCVYLQSLV